MIVVKTETSRRVVVNADDFGITEGVNQAVAACFEAGSISSATLMVTAEAAEDAAQIAGSLKRLGIGLHFNLTLGRPLSDPGHVGSLLVEGGCFASRLRLLVRWLLGRLDVADIRRELTAQLEKFTDLGLDMTHIDSHQHVHMIPPVFAAVSAHCRSQRLPMRMPWLGTTNAARPGLERRVRMTFLSAMIRRNTRNVGADLMMNRGFSSVFDICNSPREISRSVYVGILNSIDVAPFELMVHPAIVDDSLRKLTGICDYSEQEYEVLSKSSFLELSPSKDLHLVDYREALFACR
jgi:predicted glycoside hydrolase/deacetylase ChbG (UPF0249 family)